MVLWKLWLISWSIAKQPTTTPSTHFNNVQCMAINTDLFTIQHFHLHPDDNSVELLAQVFQFHNWKSSFHPCRSKLEATENLRALVAKQQSYNYPGTIGLSSRPAFARSSTRTLLLTDSASSLALMITLLSSCVFPWRVFKLGLGERNERE